MSTPASLLHAAPGTSSGVPASAMGEPSAWREELNARLRQHRARRAESTASDLAEVTFQQSEEHNHSGQADHVPARLNTATAASRVAARVAERYSQAPSYQELLAASAVAAAVAADTAAAAAHEAHIAAEAVLSGWHTLCDSAESRHAAGQDAHASQSAGPHKTYAEPGTDPFADPFFTSTPRDDEQSASSSTDLPGGAALDCEAMSLASAFPVAVTFPVTVAFPTPFYTKIEHHAPLPQRSLPPARLPMAERARLLVDAFAEAVVPAAQSLPAKLIEFPRELIAPRKQRPRLVEGPLFDDAPGRALRIFEVGTQIQSEVGSAARSDGGTEVDAAAGAASPGGQQSPVAATASTGTDDAGRQQAREHHGAETFSRNASAATPSNIYSGMANEPEDGMSRRRASFLDADEAAAPAREPNLNEAFSARHSPPLQQESGWGTIRLGEHPQPEATAPQTQPAARRPEHGYRAEQEPTLHDLAPISDRLMGALVDGGIVLACFLLSVLVFASCTVHPPAGKAALAVGLLVFSSMASFYGWLFMSYGGGSTPGMRYARIALCTFAEDNPTRKDLQNRVPATALALLPLGLGVLWALLDEDKLGWHDRMTRTYQRSYR